MTDSIRRRAQKLVRSSRAYSSAISPMASLERDISQTLEQIESLELQHQEFLVQLTEDECLIGTHVLRLRTSVSEYFLSRLPLMPQLLGQLQGIHKERRRLRQQHLDRVQDLETRLLSLINQRELLEPFQNGNGMDSSEISSTYAREN